MDKQLVSHQLVSNPLVSVIIPTYKGSRIISKCVDSVLEQSYPWLEIIVVDDNGVGTDEQIKTEEAMKKYLPYQNVLYIAHAQNKNGSAARNTGVKNSNGMYLCFLDDDDRYISDKISRQIERFDGLPPEFGIVYCSVVEVYSHNRIIVNADKEGDLLLDTFLWKSGQCSSNIMVRRNVFEEVGGFDESFKRHQDFELLIRILARYKVAAVPYIGVEKFIIGRNVPGSAKKVEEYGKYLLDRTESIVMSLPEGTRRQIYSHYYIEWAKGFLWEKNLQKYFYYSKQSGQQLICLYKCLRYIFGQFIGNRKYYKD